MKKELKKRKREEQSKEADSTHEITISDNSDDNGETDGHDARGTSK